MVPALPLVVPAQAGRTAKATARYGSASRGIAAVSTVHASRSTPTPYTCGSVSIRKPWRVTPSTRTGMPVSTHR
jgi:hypothetical protein